MTRLLPASVGAPAQARRLGREDASQGLQKFKDLQASYVPPLQWQAVGRGPRQTERRLCSPHNLTADLRGHRCVWFLLQIDLICSWQKKKSSPYARMQGQREEQTQSSVRDVLRRNL